MTSAANACEPIAINAVSKGTVRFTIESCGGSPCRLPLCRRHACPNSKIDNYIYGEPVAAGDGAGDPKLGKFTVGALSAPCCDAKNGFDENPNIPAIVFVGNRRTAVLKFCTAVLKLFRSTAMRFSDRKSTRLNSSHQIISYAVFCLKTKKTQR